MDTDDCNDVELENFKNKDMFRKHWAFKYIVPIWNTPDLEEVLVKAKIPFRKKGNRRKEEYVDIFPVSDKYATSDKVQLTHLMELLSDNPDTNLDEFIKFCLEIAH